MTVVMGLATAVGLVFMSRWWISVNRARGIPAQMPARTQWLGGALLFVAVGAIIAIEYVIYGFTNSRIAEAVVAIMFALPIGFFALPAFYQKMRPVMPIETKTWRMNYIMQIVLFVVFACNLVLMLLPERYAELSHMRDFNIAGYFVILTVTPFSIRLMRRRYLEAKALKDAVGQNVRRSVSRGQIARAAGLTPATPSISPCAFRCTARVLQ